MKKKAYEVDDLLKIVPAIPENFNVYLNTLSLHDFNFIFGYALGKKRYKLHCTHCNHDFEKELNGRKGIEVICPHCKNKYKFANSKKTIGMYYSDLFTLIQKTTDNKGLIFRMFHVTYRYKIVDKDTFERCESTIESMRDYYFFDTKKWKKITYGMYSNMGSISFGGCKEDWRYPTRSCNTDFFSYTYAENIKRIIKDTPFKYSAANLFFKDIKNQKSCTSDYFEGYTYTPKLELVTKFGYSYLLRKELANQFNSSSVELRCNLIVKKVFEIKQEFGLDISKYKFDNDEIGLLLKLKDVDLILKCKKQGIGVRTAEETLKFITINQAKRYFSKKREDYSLYPDYLRFASDLGMDMNNTKIIYPKNIKKSHDELMIEHEKYESQLLQENFDKVVKALEKLSYEKNGYIIRPAHSQSELIEESKALDHCVRSYAERMSKGETAIFFVRTERKKDKPLYTLEFKNNKVGQFRGKSNCTPDKKAKNFVDLWIKNVVNKQMKVESEL